MPVDVRAYLQERGANNGRPLSAEVARNAREKMEVERAAAANRATAATVD